MLTWEGLALLNIPIQPPPFNDNNQYITFTQSLGCITLTKFMGNLEENKRDLIYKLKFSSFLSQIFRFSGLC